MQNISERRFVEIPGSAEEIFELPPIMLSLNPFIPGQKTFDAASEIVEKELLSDIKSANENEFQEAKMCLAGELVERYSGFSRVWSLGDSVVRWIEQCEDKFQSNLVLQNILNRNVWPHAGQCSFISLIRDKRVLPRSDLPTAVGLRNIFPKLPKIRTFSSQFLFYLYANVAETSYNHWYNLSPKPILDLPPERFHFEIVDI